MHSYHTSTYSCCNYIVPTNTSITTSILQLLITSYILLSLYPAIIHTSKTIDKRKTHPFQHSCCMPSAPSACTLRLAPIMLWAIGIPDPISRSGERGWAYCLVHLWRLAPIPYMEGIPCKLIPPPPPPQMPRRPVEVSRSQSALNGHSILSRNNPQWREQFLVET